MAEIRWAILGPGEIAHNFAAGLREAPAARLVAVASRAAARAVAFGKKWELAPADCHGDYATVLARADIDAVYVATVHVTHAQLSLDALAAGKHVVCEKPAGINAAQVRAIIDRARAAERFFLEGYMYRFHPQIARMRELIAAGTIGTVQHIEAVFGYHAEVASSHRLANLDLAGGGILDVGGYPVSFVRCVAGAASGTGFAEPQRVRGVGRLGRTGVDVEAHALLEFAAGVTASCAVATSRDLGEVAKVYGSAGTLELVNPWIPGRDSGPSDTSILVTTGKETRTEELKSPQILFAFEAQAASEAIQAGATETEAMSWADSVGNNLVLDAWRDELGYAPPAEQLASAPILKGVVVPKIKIPRLSVTGVPLPMSQLVMGCDNQARDSDAAVIWDAWLEAGGNAFDTAHLYGSGVMEVLLGKWLRSRGVRDEVALIVKGAHSPWCDPPNLKLQFEESLDRLGIERADVYMMHRDNRDYPVGEFVDVLDELASAGRIGAYGGSNWELERLREANDWARAHNKQPFSVLSNNLSLAVMEQVWPGCHTGHNNELLAYLRAEKMAHFSWSSQARGYFLPEEVRGTLPPGTEPEITFGSATNAARRERANELARQKGCSANQIAAAWVLRQDLTSFALIGPRRPGEITTSLPALEVELSPAEIIWLDTGAN